MTPIRHTIGLCGYECIFPLGINLDEVGDALVLSNVWPWLLDTVSVGACKHVRRRDQAVLYGPAGVCLSIS